MHLLFGTAKRKDNRETEVGSLDEETAELSREWFRGYVRRFKSGNADSDGNIVLKEEHSIRVCLEISSIGKEIGLHEDELRLAEIIALFHDIGRFEQYARYGTFADSASVNHAELGVQVLQEAGFLGGLDQSTQSLVLRAVRYHNLPALPEEEAEPCLFFCKLLHDADKLDIWRVVTDYYGRKDDQRSVSLELGLPDTPGISEEVYQALVHGRVVRNTDLTNLNDLKLLQMGWVYDVNFGPTFARIQERRYLGMIRDALPQLPAIEEVFSLAEFHVDARLWEWNRDNR